MIWSLDTLWLIPALPLLAAGVLALMPRGCRSWAAAISISTIAISFLLSCWALAGVARTPAPVLVQNFTWLEFGTTPLRLGWVLDPLTAVMLVMVTFVAALIFVYTLGYMAHDPNLTRFFCFLSLFAAAMLTVVIANNLLLLFVGWELMGLASYLLIGFWFQKPSAAAAAKKAFITTRIGDLGLFLGMLWLYAETGTLLFYDQGAGCLESAMVTRLVGTAFVGGMGVSTAISLMIFSGAIGKSGQVPLHVWLPDAMEGPTPVSALIHAATMVAAGVFLMARVYPLVAAVPVEGAPHSEPRVPAHAEMGKLSDKAIADPVQPRKEPEPLVTDSSKSNPVSSSTRRAKASPILPSFGLRAMAWIGSITAVFAALIALAQTDIKRILAYSTVSQLGYMFLGLATGGVAVGMFHLITHAFFKALLFLGAGSVIHGSLDEQDIRRMGGLRKLMPVTFVTYAVGMMALSGVIPLSGFWSKDEILHASALWQPTMWPFFLGLVGTFLTALYMTRQMVYVFFGERRSQSHAADPDAHADSAGSVHESPSVMTVPLGILSSCTVLLSLLGTPVWPWFHAFLQGHPAEFRPSIDLGVILIFLLSTGVVAAGLGLGWWLYGQRNLSSDPLEEWNPSWFSVLRDRFSVDELYEISFVRWQRACSVFSDWFDRAVLSAVVMSVTWIGFGLAWMGRLLDEFGINLGFDQGCERVRRASGSLAGLQNGQVQRYLRTIGLGVAILAVWILWK